MTSQIQTGLWPGRKPLGYKTSQLKTVWGWTREWIPKYRKKNGSKKSSWSERRSEEKWDEGRVWKAENGNRAGKQLLIFQPTVRKWMSASPPLLISLHPACTEVLFIHQWSLFPSSDTLSNSNSLEKPGQKGEGAKTWMESMFSQWGRGLLWALLWKSRRETKFTLILSRAGPVKAEISRRCSGILRATHNQGTTRI